MKLLEKFRSHLFSKKNKPSKVTIKNYLSDIRKFINWQNTQSRESFNPKKITTETINLYKIYLHKEEASINSIERYISSLKAFFHFLKQENIINSSPFDQEINIRQVSKDPLMLNQFKLYLLSNNISKVTIKNYLMDIRQFSLWIENVLPVQEKGIFEGLNELIIDEYKNRLLKEAHLSPVSVNRKLSSLRKYMSWIGKKDIDIKKVSLEKTIKTTGPNTNNKFEVFKKIEGYNNKKIHENKNNQNYLPPLDFLFTLPLVKTLEKAEFLIWKIKGSKVFTPIQDILKKNLTAKEYQKIHEEQKEETIKSKTNKKISLLLKVFSISTTIKNKDVHNLPKSLYAPLKISIKSLPTHKRIYFHLRHTRPNWYKKYHSYQISHYFHLSLLFIFTSILGAALYNSFYEDSTQQKTAFASPPWAPPKILSFQGKLTDVQNNPITTATPLRFAIYDQRSASGSALLWQEVQTVNPDQDGIFLTEIGKENPISSSIFSDNPALYLGMTIGNDNELQPRQELATISYSQNSQQLQGLIPITKNTALTSNVILALDSAGNLSIGGKASPTFEASGGQFTISGKTVLLTSTPGSDGNIKIAPDGVGIIDLQKPLQNTSNYNNITSAQGAVEIDDLLAILATSSGQSALTINQNSTGPLISASTSGTAMFTLENNGTGMFAGNLSLKGDTLSSTNTYFNLLNTDTIDLNIGNSATAISLGADTGYTIINNTLTAKDISPSLTATYNLGTPTNHWNNAYIDNLYTNPLATISGFWQKNKGAISALNPTDDLIIAGTSTESAKFQIFGSGINAGTASTSGQLTFTNNSQINVLNNAHLGFYNSLAGNTGINTANPSLYIASNGNVGIGTNNPTAKLQINGDILGQNLKVAAGGSISFDNNSGKELANIKSIDITGYGSALVFSTKENSPNPLERMLLDPNGSLIIGGQNAKATLDVRSNSGTLSVASISGSTAIASMVVDNSGVGDLFTASSSGSTRFVITQNGNVGIGTNIPDYSLDVNGKVHSASGFNGNCINNLSYTNNGNCNQDIAEIYNASEAVESGDVVRIDIADSYGTVKKTSLPYDPQTIGIVTSRPGIILGVNGSDIEMGGDTTTYMQRADPRKPAVALNGKVLVKVSTENGVINAGDFLTTSSLPGIAMKATKPGTVIGKALESYTNTDTATVGRIMIFVNLSWADPSITTGFYEKYNLQDNNSIISHIQSLFIQAQKIVTNSLDVTTENITIGGQTLKEYITKIVQDAVKEQLALSHQQSVISSQSSAISLLSPLASESAITLKHDNSLSASGGGQLSTPYATTSATASLSGATLITNITNIYNTSIGSNSALQNASDSAIPNTPNASNSAKPDADLHMALQNTITASDSSLQNIPTSAINNLASLSGFFSQFSTLPTLSDLAVAGELNIGGSLILDNNSINTLGSDLKLQPLRQGNLSIMGELLTIDTNGNLKVSGNANFAKDVTVKGKLAANIIAPIPNSDLVIQLGNNQKNSQFSPPAGGFNSQLSILNSSNSAVLTVNQLGDILASGSGTFSKLTASALNIIRGAQADSSLLQTIASSSAGTAAITAHETERTIVNPFITKDSLIYLTATSDTQGLVPFIARQTEKDFTIAIPYAVNKDIKINWWIIN